MKLSLRAQYGIQALLELAQSVGGVERRIGEIAKSQKIPVRFLEQILLVLKRHRLVTSSRGKRGGYFLVKEPADITMKEVVEALEGPIQFSNKKMKRFPVIFEILEEIEANLKKNLEKITLEELVMRKRQKEGAVVYHI